MRSEREGGGGWYERLICDDRGFTTVGIAVALLVSIALVLSSTQVYKINSASAEIQEVADAAALAAQNEVAEFVVVVRVCDALVLSMTILGTLTYGVGIVTMCVPATAQLSAKLVEYGQKIFDARDDFARKAAEGLDRLQRALPFLAAVSAARVAAANNETGALAASYFAVAVLVPFEGEQISTPTLGGEQQLESDLEAQSDAIGDLAYKAEDLACQANDVKQRAFEADCGASPDRCMRERAERLAGLSSSRNPHYQSVDAWSFSVALDRARAYYAARLEQEVPTGTVKERANSVLRKMYYRYAVDQLSTAYVLDTEEAFSAHFPVLPANTQEMRGTPLYSEAAFPVTDGGTQPIAHAWSGCPGAVGYARCVSAQQIEEGDFAVCPQCQFSVSSLGNVAAASSSIDNGFEYHYRIVASAAEEYERLRADLDPAANELKRMVSGLMDQCAEVVKNLKDVRLETRPPGYAGTIALVVNVERSSVDLGDGIVGGAVLGARVAVSGATLVEEPASAEGSVLASLLDGFGSDAGAAIGAARVVLAGWSNLLSAYGTGQEGLSLVAGEVLEMVPILGESGLGEWSADRFREAMESVGLQPAELGSVKPVLINTGYVVGADSGAFSVTFERVRQGALSSSTASTDAFSVVLSGLSFGLFELLDSIEGEGIEIARIEFPVGDVSIPVTIALPKSAVDGAQGLIEGAIDAVASVRAEHAEVNSWQ